jgi:hypothetical protein
MNRITAKTVTAKMVKFAMLDASRNGMHRPREHDSMRSDVSILPLEVAVPARAIIHACPVPARHSVVLNAWVNVDSRKESG